MEINRILKLNFSSGESRIMRVYDPYVTNEVEIAKYLGIFHLMIENGDIPHDEYVGYEVVDGQ